VLVPASATLVDTLRGATTWWTSTTSWSTRSCSAAAKRLFKEGAAGTDLQLTDCRKAGPDVLLLILRPASRQDGGDSPGQDDSPAS